ncbi:MAG: MarR family transcriptional regulator [Actinomycetota bacterium]|nr:MarR family transcriptional regulator [Actinomycetota bacterium]
MEDELEVYIQELWNIIIRIMRKFRNTTLTEEDIELSPPQGVLLMELSHSGALSMSELSQHLEVNQGVTTRMVDRLVEKGLVKRERSRDDRRVVMVSVSEKGLKVIRRLEEDNLDMMKELLHPVSEEDREVLLALVKGIEQSLEQGEQR